MRQVLLKGLAVLLFTNVIAIIAGCEEANQSDVRKHRLIATENKQLQADLQRRDKEIQNQKDQLAKCEKEKQDWQQNVEKEIKDQSNAVLSDVIVELGKLREENERLKAEVEQLKSKTGRSE